VAELKRLRDRERRKLSTRDIAHYHEIVVALSETIRLKAQNDAVFEKRGGSPIK